ncbi:MAG TPA: hypothetical protein ENJ29_08250 [Bacteroidetes bacterium]|nr:hypothetical protein [Bacteroidota bacterium]
MNRKNLFALIMFPLLFLLLIAYACSSTTTTRKVANQSPVTPAAVSEDEKHLDVDFTISCLECHTEETPEVVADWSAGTHGKVNVGCFVCHGDGEDEYYASPGTDACLSCHDSLATEVAEAQTDETCFTCHDGHKLKFHAEQHGGFGASHPGWLRPDSHIKSTHSPQYTGD